MGVRCLVVDVGRSGSARGADAGPLDLSRHLSYPVVQVIDGDTIVVKHDSRGIVMQLRGIEANREGAKAFLRDLLVGESVHLVDAPDGPRDRNGHFSAYFFRVRDKLFVNQTILGQGYGIATGDAGPHGRLFALMEQLARSQKRGLWSKEDLHQPLPTSQMAIAERAKTIEHRRALHESWRAWSDAEEIAEFEFEAAAQLGTSILTVQNDRDAKFRVTLRGDCDRCRSSSQPARPGQSRSSMGNDISPHTGSTTNPDALPGRSHPGRQQRPDYHDRPTARRKTAIAQRALIRRERSNETKPKTERVLRCDSPGSVMDWSS